MNGEFIFHNSSKYCISSVGENEIVIYIERQDIDREK